MTTQELSEEMQPEPDGGPSSLDISWRARVLMAAVRSELLSAVMSCLAGAAARGYSQAELEESSLGGSAMFLAMHEGVQPTLEQAADIAQACGYRLRITMELLDDEVQTSPDNITTPFEVASQWMANHAALKHISGEARDEILRQILVHYFGQMREKGLYIAQRS